MMIRDTSAQDRTLSQPPQARSRRPLWLAGGAIAGVLTLGWLLSG